jgi:hypothetical protein
MSIGVLYLTKSENAIFIGEHSPLVGQFLVGKRSRLVGQFVIGERYAVTSGARCWLPNYFSDNL